MQVVLCFCPALPRPAALLTNPPHPTHPSVVQAWFPAHAEIWNAPTWFLSALTFAMIVLPHVVRGGQGGCGLPPGGRKVYMQCLAWICLSQMACCGVVGLQPRGACFPEGLSCASSLTPSPLHPAAARHC